MTGYSFGMICLVIIIFNFMIELFKEVDFSKEIEENK